MRHGESTNNLLMKVLSRDDFNQQRTTDPGLSPKGEADCIAVGQALKQMNFKIDRMFTSAFKRTILTAKHVFDAYVEAAQGQALAERGCEI